MTLDDSCFMEDKMSNFQSFVLAFVFVVSLVLALHFFHVMGFDLSPIVDVTMSSDYNVFFGG